MEQNNQLSPQSEYSYSTKSGYAKINKKKIELDRVKADCSLLAFFILLLLFLQSAMPYVLSSALLHFVPTLVDERGVPLGVDLQIVAQGVVYVFAMGLTLAAAWYSTGYRRHNLQVRLAPVGDWLMQLFAVLAMGVIGSFAGNVFNSLCGNFGLNYQVSRIVCSSWTNLLLLIVTYGVLPALLEEMLFREVVFAYFSRYGASFAVLVSAFGFGAIHYQPGAMINAFLVGLVLTYARMRCGSVLPCMALHGVYNLFVLFMMLAQQQYQLTSPWVYAVYLVVLCLGVASFVGLNLRSSQKMQQEEQASTFFDKVGAGATSSGFWIMAALLVYAMIEQGR